MDRQLMDDRNTLEQFIMKFGRMISVILASSFISGCMVGPKYYKPVVQTPTAYRDLRESPQAEEQAASYADLRWWQVFQDPQLQELMFQTALLLPFGWVELVRRKEMRSSR